jgi:hypothetical protein
MYVPGAFEVPHAMTFFPSKSKCMITAVRAKQQRGEREKCGEREAYGKLIPTAPLLDRES